MTNYYFKNIKLVTFIFTLMLSQSISARFVSPDKNLKNLSTETLACTENSSEASQGAFSTGYNVSFETVGNNVVVTFELLDTDKVGVIAYLWRQTPFAETAMTNTSGLTFTATLTGQTIGSTITYACKFAYAGGMSVTKYFNYEVGNNCNGGGNNDTEAPTNFTASVGTITSTSVQLLLNGTDNSGSVIYNVSYGTNSASTSSASGVQKSLIINNLTPETTYTFSITASDLAGNNAANNPIVLQATTTAETNTECSGTSSDASQGAFSTGYTYSFQTTGTDVTFTFELLDTDKVGVIAYLWQQTPFAETGMDNVSGLTFTKTLGGQTPGATISYACKFAYAGGLSVTKFFNYTVGNTCSLGLDNNEINQSIKLYPNPAKNFLNIETGSVQVSKVELYSILGNKVVKTTATETINIENLSRGMYLAKIYTDNNKIVTKKLVVE